MATLLRRAGLSNGVGMQAALPGAIDQLQAVDSPAQLLNWSAHAVQRLLPHGAFLAGAGRIRNGQASITKLLCRDFPQAHLRQIVAADCSVASPILERWLQQQQPQLFEPAQCDEPDSLWQRSFLASALHNIAAHGQLDTERQSGSYFVFCRIPSYLTPTHARLLRQLVPHLHAALVRVLPQMPAWQPPRGRWCALSARERQVLRLLRDAKSNAEIASSLGTSRHTVKHQVGTLLGKLGAKHRSEAVALALRQGWLPERRTR